VPARGEALIRIKASGINPTDIKRRSAASGEEIASPIIPHSDGAGIIEDVGAGVDVGRVGQRVWLWNARWGREHGTAAEHVALPSA
jgi:NADPH2:quinone reductase